MDTTELKYPRISRVWAKNFRSIENLELDLESLTVLVGPNASGKSNIVDVLHFISDAMNVGLDSALTSRRGDHVARRISSKRRFIDVTVGLTIDNKESTIDYQFVVRLYKDARHRVVREEVRLTFSESDAANLHLEITNGKLTEPKLKRPKGIGAKDFESLLGRMRDSAREITDELDVTGLAFPFQSLLATINFFHPVHFSRSTDRFLDQFHKLREAHRFQQNMRFYHIFPDALREPQLLSSKYPLEEHGENLASVLADMKSKKSTYLPELVSVLGQVVPGLKDISVTRAGGHLVIRLLHQEGDDPKKGIWLNASQESDATLRTLGLLVALYQDPTPPFIAIEEPELTIHPGALSVLADLISETSHRTTVLVTTHSPELLDRLPIDCIRSVEAHGGATIVGPVAEHQKNAVSKGLFSAGELHRMEGLQHATKVES